MLKPCAARSVKAANPFAMSQSSNKRSDGFLKISDQFQLGALTTEASHPVTANLSEVAKQDISAALGLLFEVDSDVLRKYREFVESNRAVAIKDTLVRVIKNGGRLFFTGCGSTGRLSIQLVSIWRDFWQPQRARGLQCSPPVEELENRAFAVMAGGDFALIKAVEGFEDFTAFGKKQLGDQGVSSKDAVFAITEGGETSFVIGTAWKGVEVGAKVYFIYNNPDEVLCDHVQRSREIIEDQRIEKLNLTTGPMAITGSTRMQATTIQLAVLFTVLEMALRDLMAQFDPSGKFALPSSSVPEQFLHYLTGLLRTLKSPSFLQQLADLTRLEESTYRSRGKANYFADRFGIDVLTDTTERSPTYCTPPFRKFDDATATESWAFLFVPDTQTPQAWQRILKRKPNCVEWSYDEVTQLVDREKVSRTYEIVRKISSLELMRFKIGSDGLPFRSVATGDCAIGVVAENEKASLISVDGFHRLRLGAARQAGARTGLIFVGEESSVIETNHFVQEWLPDCLSVFLTVPKSDFLLDGVSRLGVKMLLNALSTCTMVRLGRVMGNYMIWVVASNLKLIDRSTRYIQKLTGLEYAEANQLLFEVLEYVEPRMKADQAYPPVVGLAVLRARHKLSNVDAEHKLMTEL
jgi:N-acetylmuramic acid 6-phosphate etherase